MKTRLWAGRAGARACLLLAAIAGAWGCKADQKGGFTPPPTPPLLALSDTTIDFTGIVGGADPAGEGVNVLNFGGGDLDGLTVTSVSYGGGQPTGWLAVGSAGSPPIISLQPSTAGLPAGDFTATIMLLHPTASNSPLSMTVALHLNDQPVISVATTQVRFATTLAAPIPAAQALSVVNIGPGALTGLSLGTVSYAQGQPTGWLTASLAGSTAPTTLTLRPNTTNLPAGTYVASVPVASAAAVNTPVPVAVSFTLSSSPVIQAAPSSFTLSGTTGGPNPAPVTTAITNAGAGSLTGLKVEPIAFNFGASNWVTASLNTTTAPATLTITPNIAGVNPGNYLATIPISSTDPAVDTIAVRVNLSVVSPPAIAFSASAVNFSAVTGGSTPGVQSVVITNGGTGTLSGISIGSVAYGAGASGWLSTALSSTAAPATLTLTPNITGIAAGSFTATVPVSSNVPGVATRNLSVTLTLSSAVPGGMVILGGDNQTTFVGNTLITPLSVRVLTTAGTPFPGVPVTWTVNNGGSLSSTSSVTNANGDASTTWTVGPNAGTQTVSAQTPGVPAVVFSADVQARTSAGYPNQPPGYTAITDRAFNAKVEDGWIDRGDVSFTITNDGSAPRSAPSIGSAEFSLGRSGGTAPILTGRDLTQAGNFTSLYLSFWIKFSSNWDGHTSHVNKIYHLWINGQNKVYLSAQGSDAGPLRPQVRLQGIPGPSVTRNLLPNLSTLQLQRGNWHRWELVITANTVGSANGTVEWWIDGIKAGSYSDVQITDASRRWTEVDWNPTWGGTGDIVPADQFMYMDHIYISGKP